MKTLKSLLWGFSLSALFFVSCGNENEPTNPGGGGTLPTDRSQLVTSMIEYETDSYDFTYDSNNRLTYVEGNIEDNDFYYKFTYSPLSIIAGDYQSSFKYDLNVNDDGYITFCKFSDGDKTYEYNDGYLVKSVFKDSYNDITETVYTWENGNLIKIELKEDVGSNVASAIIYNYSYTENSTDNTGVCSVHNLEEEFFMLGGLLGKMTSKIPVSVEVEYSWIPEQPEKTNINVEYDNKGRIIKYFENEELKRVYAYEGNKAVWSEN